MTTTSQPRRWDWDAVTRILGEINERLTDLNREIKKLASELDRLEGDGR